MTVATTAPLPQPMRLLALGRRAAGDTAVAAPWLRPGDVPLLFSRAAWGLRAIADLRAGTHRRRPVVWLPDYFCDSATRPLRAAADPAFYPILDDLQPDWQECERRAAIVPPDIFVLVHYFGRPVETATADAFCRLHGAVLIEDAAHVLARDEAVGGAGAATLWSLYKHLPAPDGGLLVLHSGDGLEPERARDAAAALGRRAPGALPWIARRLLQGAMPALASRLRAQPPPFDVDPAPAPTDDRAAMSAAARRLVAEFGGELDRIAERRRANERALREAFAVTDLRPLLDSPHARWTPYRAVFRAPSPERARHWYERISGRGNAVESWPDLPAEVHGDPEMHRIALALRATTIALPVHADRTPDELVAAYGTAL